jgi:hypothetical protein
VRFSAQSPEARRLLEADEMYRLGLDMLRTRYRREQPDADDDEIERLVRAWIADRPFDSPGTPRQGWVP